MKCRRRRTQKVPARLGNRATSFPHQEPARL